MTLRFTNNGFVSSTTNNNNNVERTPINHKTSGGFMERPRAVEVAPKIVENGDSFGASQSNANRLFHGLNNLQN
eukprot:CAMPEP_0176361128 /NCGR_PEP_ID=MMETSP0126-20121128/17521_1 /TAXON_ID=141414 ORGANISM="Strombidinopsis acuminatum, Strain SPMC142" /NCGR_SAMPLE_ID=MMETSP0126 /ASSEMBLY_ACC=CAM_ASM_000229 /LENGTH=73 /DNA_ID=CAMNT_0017716541 /DNA_START=2401 /DNA_END=2622 /DNA_ORIENTATION=-